MIAQLPRVALAFALLCAAIAGAGVAAPAQHDAYLPLVAAPVADPDLAAIAVSAAGLWYPSEADAPLEPFVARAPTPADACAAEIAPGEPVEVGDAGLALAGPAQTAPWMSDAQRGMAARFAALRAEIDARLSGAISCQVGRIRVRVLILGVAPSGLVVGLRTVVTRT